MALKDALSILESKPVLGEYGAVTRPFVLLDVDEYRLIVSELKAATRRKRVPRETSREASV